MRSATLHLITAPPEPPTPAELQARWFGKGAIEREDVKEYPGGHVWRRHAHAEVAVKVVARRDWK